MLSQSYYIYSFHHSTINSFHTNFHLYPFIPNWNTKLTALDQYNVNLKSIWLKLSLRTYKTKHASFDSHATNSTPAQVRSTKVCLSVQDTQKVSQTKLFCLKSTRTKTFIHNYIQRTLQYKRAPSPPFNHLLNGKSWGKATGLTRAIITLKHDKPSFQPQTTS